jgi:hypothetical protein
VLVAGVIMGANLLAIGPALAATRSKCLSRLFPQRDHAIGDWVSRRRR